MAEEEEHPEVEAPAEVSSFYFLIITLEFENLQFSFAKKKVVVVVEQVVQRKKLPSNRTDTLAYS